MRNTEVAADQVRARALEDLEFFIKLVHPDRVLGQCHKDLIAWMTRQGALSHQLILLPRDHQKSAMAAYRVAWEITKNPAIRVLYISSTSDLAEKQLGFIKNILTSRIYRRYWPEMVNPEESKREKWTNSEISVDHPQRRALNVRDPTVFTAGLTTNITGLHSDINVCDDIVVGANAYTSEGREKVAGQASYLASIGGTDGKNWVFGTRYHPLDQYAEFMKMHHEVYDDEGNVIETVPLFEKYERVVEDVGDGTGQFLWPRTQGPDGRWFGFDRNILAKKRAEYNDVTKFRSQYYNNPNDISSGGLYNFQYYDPKFLYRREGKWYFNRTRLNVFAAVDFAYSLSRKADYTAIVVVGVDSQHNYYVLDIDRFKTQDIREYFDRILKLHMKWGFRKLRAETTAAQIVLVKELRDSYIRPHGLALSIEEFRPTRHQGTKEERIEAILQPKYSNNQVFHFPGGNCEILEEELRLAKPAHDDIKDCLASCIDSAVAPQIQSDAQRTSGVEIRHNRFGGLT